MDKMLIVRLGEQNVFNRQICKILREKYSNTIEDYINEDILMLPEVEVERFVNKYEIVVIYNGYRPNQKKLLSIIRKLNKKIIFHESGHLPQSYPSDPSKYLLNIHIDYQGLYGESSLCGDLGWVSDDYIKEFKDFTKNSFYKQFLESRAKEEYILCPLQLDWDSSLISSNLTNLHLIAYVCSRYRNEKILFKCHPRHDKAEVDQIKKIIRMYSRTNKNVDILDNDTQNNSRPSSEKNTFLSLALNAKAVLGLNSTALLDSLCIGKRTIAIAPCPLKFHISKNKDFYSSREKDALLAGYFKSRYLYSSYPEALDRLKILFSRAGWDF